MTPPIKLVKYIANLGYGSRREVERLFDQRRITRANGRTLRATDDVAGHEEIRVDGDPLDAPPGSVIMLHKPVGYVCSTRDAGSQLVYDLLPLRFPLRAPVIAPIGRLDRESSGLLLLTDDGQLNHRITSPRTHLAKVYEARLASDLRGDEGELFAAGRMMLDGESSPLAPATLEILDPRTVRVTLTEGRYHQVRRMFAAVGNHVDLLHRRAIGALSLGGLASGAWRVLEADEVARLRTASPAPHSPESPG